MGVGNIFVATTLAPLVIVLASVSLQLLTIGLEQLKNCEKYHRERVTRIPLVANPAPIFLRLVFALRSSVLQLSSDC